MGNISTQLAAKLRKAREKFVKAEPAESSSVVNRKVPDGTYTAKLVGVEFAEFGKHPILRFTYEISDADKKTHESAIGQLVETRFNLDTDEGPSFIKRDFGRFGYDEVDDLLDDLEQAEALFVELIGLNPVCKIAVNMDDTDQWQNVFLNDVLEMDEAEDETSKEEVKEEPVTSTTRKGGKKKESEPEPEEEDEADDSNDDEGTAELNVGDLVEVTYKGKDVAATVVSMNEEDETVKVQLTKEKKRIVVPLSEVYLIEG